MAKILVVEDDTTLARNVSEWLTLEHHVVEFVADGTEALARLRFYQYDAIVLDWKLPDIEGIEVCRRFRASGGSTPILMLTGKKEIEEKEAGLDAGADDYLTKPFNLRELSARVRALLRRLPNLKGENLSCAGVTLNTVTCQVFVGSQEVKLLPKELALLEFFMKHPRQVFSAEALLDNVWQSTSEVSPDSVRTYITRLRQKIEMPGSPSIIQTVHGLGYRLSDDKG